MHSLAALSLMLSSLLAEFPPSLWFCLFCTGGPAVQQSSGAGRAALRYLAPKHSHCHSFWLIFPLTSGSTGSLALQEDQL